MGGGVSQNRPPSRIADLLKNAPREESAEAFTPTPFVERYIMPKSHATTPASQWLVPNQDKLEQVIDARFALHNTPEVPEKSEAKSTPAAAKSAKGNS